jgi:hypothetical protein
MTDLFGQVPVPVNRSPASANDKGPPILDISGPNSGGSSVSAILQQSLENRLRQQLAGRGSPLYAMTWKRLAMASGPSISALRASALRTSGSGSTGLGIWVPCPWCEEFLCVIHAQHTSGCPCPDIDTFWAMEIDPYLVRAPTGWPSPYARDWKDSPGMAATGVNPDGSVRRRLDRVGMLVYGQKLPSWSAVTDELDLYRWLMGYPELWTKAGQETNQLRLWPADAR